MLRLRQYVSRKLFFLRIYWTIKDLGYTTHLITGIIKIFVMFIENHSKAEEVLGYWKFGHPERVIAGIRLYHL